MKNCEGWLFEIIPGNWRLKSDTYMHYACPKGTKTCKMPNYNINF